MNTLVKTMCGVIAFYTARKRCWEAASPRDVAAASSHLAVIDISTEYLRIYLRSATPAHRRRVGGFIRAELNNLRGDL